MTQVTDYELIVSIGEARKKYECARMAWLKASKALNGENASGDEYALRLAKESAERDLDDLKLALRLRMSSIGGDEMIESIRG